MRQENETTTDEPTDDKLTPDVDSALKAALNAADDVRVREHIRRARQRRVIVSSDEIFECDDCEEIAPDEHRREYLPPEREFAPATEAVDSISLCLECSTRRPGARIYRPADRTRMREGSR